MCSTARSILRSGSILGLVGLTALATINTQSAMAALAIERAQGEPLRPKLEQTRLSYQEAASRLQDLEILERDLERNLAVLESEQDALRSGVSDAGAILKDWHQRQETLTQTLHDEEERSKLLQQALTEPLAALALAQAQNQETTEVFKLETVIKALLEELNRTNQSIQSARTELATGEAIALEAQRARGSSTTRLSTLNDDISIAAEAHEAATRDIEVWQELVRNRSIALGRYETILAALEQEVGLIIQPPAGFWQYDGRIRRNPAWPNHQIRPAPGGQSDTPNVAVMPVDGQIVSEYGQSKVAPLDRGILIEAQAGSRIVAPRAGKVVFAGPFQRYGQLLIIDHGDGYHTLLAGFDWLGVNEDVRVEAGQLVGSLASDRQGNSRLYLELRQRGEPANPLPWLAARSDKVRG